MTIHVGDHLPNITLKKLTPNGPQDINTEALFKDKTVVLFAIPGAFTPTCTAVHLPSFNQKMADFKAKGLDVMCLAVNDPFVLDAWRKFANIHTDMVLLSDWNADFTKAVGLTLDASGAGLGLRSLRYSMIIKNGIVTTLNVEDNPSVCDISSADHLLKAL